MDIDKIRKDFPLLNEAVYLDNAATSLSPEPVIASLIEYERHYRSNVGRGIHRLSQISSQRYWDAHKKVSRFIGGDKGTLAFTKNTTEAIQMVASGIRLERGDHVIATVMEHHSNLLPWLRLRDLRGIECSFIPIDKKGSLEVESFSDAITDKTKLVTVTYVSNVTGAITPVREIGKICRERDVQFLIDGAQAVPHMPVDVSKTGCDYFCFSGHKMLGPTGTGALWVKEAELEPLLIGGGAVEDASLEGYVAANGFERYEAGTPNISGFIGLGRAVEYLEEIGMKAVQSHDNELTSNLIKALSEIPNVTVIGKELEKRTGVISFTVGKLKTHDVALLLSEEADIMVRSGHHCCKPLMRELGLPDGTVRASLACYNSPGDIDLLIDTVKTIAKVA